MASVDLSLPPHSTPLGGINSTADGIQWRAYVETVSYTTNIVYYNPLSQSRLLYFRTVKKDGNPSKGSALVNSCADGRARKNNVSAFNCIRVEEIDKATYDQLRH